ncbi:MAG TPA: glycosyltransferase [Pirellulales bacterium]|nr:glycosyltransferase [Pirellulales bacterium]
MEVAWLFEYPTLHGGERSLLACLPGLQSAGWRPLALAPAGGALAEELQRLGIEHLSFSVFDDRGQRLPREALRQKLATVLRHRRPELLHANSLSMGRLAGPPSVRAGVPSISHLRDIVRLSPAAVADLNAHTRLLAVSHATRTFHLSQGVRGELCHVAYNGVDRDAFQPRPATGWLHCKLGLSGEVDLAVTIGQLVMRKGHDVLVRAAARLRDAFPQLHWVIAGERFSQKAEAVQYETDLRTAIVTAGLAERFHFLGTIDRVAELLNEAKLLVHPARQEPLGRVLLEAAASGVPCVATDVGGTREIFNAAQARLAPPGDDQALAAAVAGLMADAAERARLAAAARRRIAEAFDVRAAARVLAAHYSATVR